MDRDQRQRYPQRPGESSSNNDFKSFRGFSRDKVKPKTKSPFWSFAMKRDKELKNAGENLTPVQLQNRIGPEWQAMTDEERKAYGAKNYTPPHKPVNAAEVLEREAEKYAALNLDPKKAHIRNSYGQNVHDLMKRKFDKCLREQELRYQVMGSIEAADMCTKTFVLAASSVYVLKVKEYDPETGVLIPPKFQQSYPAEFAIIAFSLKEGIVDMYHTFIDPGELAPEYTLEMFENKKKLNLPRTDYGRPEYQDYANIYGNIVAFLKRYTALDEETLIYALTEESIELEGSLNWLALKSNSNKKYTIHPLDFLVSQLSRHSSWAKLYREGRNSDPLATITGSLTSRYVAHCINKNNPQIEKARLKEEIFFPHFVHPESAATEYMHSMNLAYDDFLACPHHRINSDGINYCPLLVVRKHAYHILDLVVLNFGIPVIPGRHIPYERNIRKVAANFGLGLYENVERNFKHIKPLPGYEPLPPPPPKAPFSYEKGIGDKISYQTYQMAEALASMSFLDNETEPEQKGLNLREEEFMKSTESIVSTGSSSTLVSSEVPSSRTSAIDSSSDWEDPELSDGDFNIPHYDQGALYRTRFYNKGSTTPFQEKHAEKNRLIPMSGFRLVEPSSSEAEDDCESSIIPPPSTQYSGNISGEWDEETIPEIENVLTKTLENLEIK